MESRFCPEVSLRPVVLPIESADRMVAVYGAGIGHLSHFRVSAVLPVLANFGARYRCGGCRWDADIGAENRLVARLGRQLILHYAPPPHHTWTP